MTRDISTRMALAVGICIVIAVSSCGAPKQAVQEARSAPAIDHGALLSQQAVDAVIWQATSAEAHRLFQQGYELARIRLDENMKQLYGMPPAVVVDVDETVLDNSPYEVTAVAISRTYLDSSWTQWVAMRKAMPLPGSVEFLTYAAGRGCEIFYVTNRNADHKDATVANLQQAGFPMADNAHVFTAEGTTDKTMRRKAISMDYDIKLVIGDQLRDFDEVFKDRWDNYGRPQVDAMQDTLRKYFVLLPNPMYGTWRDAISGNGSDAEKLEAIRNYFEKNAY